MGSHVNVYVQTYSKTFPRNVASGFLVVKMLKDSYENQNTLFAVRDACKGGSIQ